MLSAVEGVVRSTDGHTVTLKHKNGKESLLELGMQLLILEGRALTLWDGFSFESEVGRRPTSRRL